MVFVITLQMTRRMTHSLTHSMTLPYLGEIFWGNSLYPKGHNLKCSQS